MSKEEYVKASIELAGNVAHLRWILGTDIDQSDARAAMAALATVCAHYNYPLLIHLDDMRWPAKLSLDYLPATGPSAALRFSEQRPLTMSSGSST